MSSRRSDRPLRLVFRLAPLLSSLLVAACGPGPPGAATDRAASASPRRPDIVLVVLDTVRRDRLGVYGSRRPTTPALDRFAREAALFERAYATAPWTKPSIASIQTGQWPSRHGCREVSGGLAPAADTMAEILGRAGYARRGVVSHRLVAGRSQLDQGFERYRADHARGNAYVSTPGVVEQAIEDLDELARDERPFLLFVHFFDAHARYLRYPAAGFAAARAGRLDGEEPLDVLRSVAASATPEEAEFLSALYDEEVRRVDDGVGRLLDHLRASGRWDRAAVLITADHGEELGQRGWLEHTRTLHDELVAVPLLVKPPGPAGGARRVRPPVSLVSILPTVLEWTGATTEAALDGVSLAGAIGGAPVPAAAFEPVFFEVSYRSMPGDAVGDVHRRGVRQGRFKLLENLARSPGGVELYDLEADPLERVNLAGRADHAEGKRRLRGLFEHLARARSGALPETPDPRDAEDLEMLRSLGYVGGG